MKQAWATVNRKRSIPPPDAQQIVSSDQCAVSGRESVPFVPITSNDSDDDSFSRMQGD
jgi:hypothetical protein